MFPLKNGAFRLDSTCPDSTSMFNNSIVSAGQRLVDSINSGFSNTTVRSTGQRPVDQISITGGNSPKDDAILNFTHGNSPVGDDNITRENSYVKRNFKIN